MVLIWWKIVAKLILEQWCLNGSDIVIEDTPSKLGKIIILLMQKEINIIDKSKSKEYIDEAFHRELKRIIPTHNNTNVGRLP